ncbi:nucleotidyltransferase family protein [Prauserella endophytica]|uniref:CBS domain-containing protein n=1 Tax=Prauserella endophytica TaxID=1592324 RepID=A0ABY2RZM0_9PSEU|nr:nucleotidyltransferase family protein [Prauserella endophytica]TKG66655.1 CBS domain-containing protein [Prauserella endophytica]
MPFADLLIRREASIRSALSTIDKQRARQAFVVDGRGRLVGSIDEADIRRALLEGAGLGAPAYPLIHKSVVTTKLSTGRAEVLDLMRALRLSEIPVIDEQGRVVGVHRERELVGTTRLKNWAVIMAGGRGTRLAPLTDNIPKPMLPVAGRPILERLVLHLVGSGINRVFISVNYLGKMIEEHFGDGTQFGCEIEYLREDPELPLGTGGSLRLLDDLGYEPTDPFLVMNGDLVTEFSVTDLLDAHVDSGAVATIAATEYQHQVPFGVLESSAGRLLRMVEKPLSSWAVNAGIYVLEPKLITRIPRGKLFPITALFDDCLASGWSVGLWPMHEPWQDVGRPNELAHARGQL